MAALAWVYPSDVINWGVSRGGEAHRRAEPLTAAAPHCVSRVAAERTRPGRGFMSLASLLCIRMRYGEHFCVGKLKRAL